MVGPVTDLINDKRYDEALAASDALAASYPAEACPAALRCLALVGLGRIASAREAVAGAPPPARRSCLALCLHAAASCGAHAAEAALAQGRDPRLAFEAFGRALDYEGQQKAAMALFSRDKDPRYLSWSAVALLSHESPPPALLSLAATMLERLAPPPATLPDLYVRVELLRALGRKEDALALALAAPEAARDREAMAELLEGDALRAFYRAAPDAEDWFYAGGLARRFGDASLAPPDSRAGLQARLEAAEPAGRVRLLARYFEVHGRRECAFDDVRRFLVALDPAEALDLYERAGRPPALERLALPAPPLADLAARAAAHAAAGRVLLSAHFRLLASQFDERHLVDAALLLEREAEARPRDPQVRLLLVRVWALLAGGAAFGRGLEHYAALGVKQIQHETVAHLVVSDAARAGCARALARAVDDTDALHSRLASENARCASDAVRRGNYAKAVDMVRFARRTRRSAAHALCRAEGRRVSLLLGPRRAADLDAALAAAAERDPGSDALDDDDEERAAAGRWEDLGDRGAIRLWEGDGTALARRLAFPPVSVHAAGAEPETPEAHAATVGLWQGMWRAVRLPAAAGATRAVVGRLRNRLEALGVADRDCWAAVFLAAEAAAELRELREAAGANPDEATQDELLERWARLPRRADTVAERVALACAAPGPDPALATGVMPWMSLFVQRLAETLPSRRRKKKATSERAQRAAAAVDTVRAALAALADAVAEAASDLARRLERREPPVLETADPVPADGSEMLAALQAHATRHAGEARHTVAAALRECAAAHSHG